MVFSWAIKAHDGWAWATPKSSEMIVLLLYLHHFCSEELVFCGSQFVIRSVLENLLQEGGLIIIFCSSAMGGHSWKGLRV